MSLYHYDAMIAWTAWIGIWMG